MWSLAKKSPKKNLKKVLAIDLGGTKIAAAAVDERGRLWDLRRESVRAQAGPAELIQQIVEISAPLIKKYKIKTGAIASAGPLDPIKGTLLNPTNLKTQGEMWGVVPLTSKLERALKVRFFLENDAAAAALAEYWRGAGRGAENLISVTLGTGLGVGVIANGQLVRSGRNLHPEAGHIIISHGEKEWLCGCGNYGCAEAFLSGVNFTHRLAERWKDSKLIGEELVRRARSGDETVRREFDQYADRLATFLLSLVVLFSPERIILSGGFSHASDLFLDRCTKRLSDLLKTRREGHDLMPNIKVSPFQNEAGVLGAAFVALGIQK